MPQPAVFETGAATFAQDVVEASRTVPILVDFWAEWCSPCKQLGPLLERMATESGGAFRLAKVDTEREQELAGMFQIQSIPFVVAFLGGRPADAFVGVQDEAQVRAFLQRIGVELAEAAPVTETPDSPLTKAAALLRARRLDEIDRVRQLLEEVEEDDEGHARSQRLLEAMPFFVGTMGGEGPASAAAAQARERWLAGEDEAAMRGLLEAVEADRRWEGELARKALVALMQLHEEHAELVDSLRRRLTLLLY